MENNGQVARYCPHCKDTTDQQFTLLEETKTTYTLFWNCLQCCIFEETKIYDKEV